MNNLKLPNVDIKSTKWNKPRYDKKGELTKPPTVQIALEIEWPDAKLVRDLVEFAQDGPTTWDINSVQRAFSEHVGAPS